jgi:hypothetical protein
MTEDEITEMKVSLLQAMRRNGGAGVRVTIKNFVAAAELVKHDQAECRRPGRPALHPRPGIGLCVGAERSPSGERAPHQSVCTP